MALKTQTIPEAGGFMAWAPGGDYNVEPITVLDDEVLLAGAVITPSGGTVTTAASAANTGDGDFAATPVGLGGVMEGDYTLLIVTADTNAGEFMVFRPDGSVLGVGTVGVAFANELGFTLEDSDADFVVGDSITISVAGPFKWIERAVTAPARGILWADVDATPGDSPGVAVVRGPCVVTAAELVHVSGASGAQKAAALADLKLAGIIAR